MDGAAATSFRATLELNGKTATGICVPDEVVAALGSGKRPPVQVTLAGYTYRSTVASMGGRFMLPVSAEVRERAGIAAGEEVDVALAPDSEPREVAVPPDLAAALGGAPEARRLFDGLSYSKQKAVVVSIESAEDGRDAAAAHRQGGRHAARGPRLGRPRRLAGSPRGPLRRAVARHVACVQRPDPRDRRCPRCSRPCRRRPRWRRRRRSRCARARSGRAPCPGARCRERGPGREPISHWASEALRLPVTGSSTTAPSLGKKARTSKSAGRSSGCGPTRPRSSSLKPGLTARTASASASRMPIQGSPLSHQAASTIALGSRPRMPAIRSRRPASSAPERSSGGAANASPFSIVRTGTRPIPHSCTITPGRFGCPPCASHAWHVPSVGCPAKGASSVGVKIRTR